MKFNPYDSFIFFDSCAFDGGTAQEQEASAKAREILDAKGKKIMLMHSVVSEIRAPKTPEWLKESERTSRKTVELPLTELEQKTFKEVEEIIVGDGLLEKRKADCFHVFEAQKYGGCFVTSDVGIYKHAEKIREKFGLFILKPTDFLKLVVEHSETT